MTKKPTAKPESTLEVAATALHEGLVGMRATIRELAEGSYTPIGESAADMLARLTHKASLVAAECRKADNDAAKRNTELERNDVVAWLRALKASDWSAIRREIDAKHSGKSGLA